MDLRQTILETIASYKSVDVAEVTPQRTFEELQIDSLDAIDIIYDIEDQLSIEVPQDALKLDDLKTIGDLLGIVEVLVAQKPGQASGATTD